MRVLEDICELLEDELKQIVKKDELSSIQDLEIVYKAVDIIKDIETIKAMKKADNNYSYSPYYDSYEMGSYDMNGNSRRRGRNSRGEYSRDEEKDMLMQKIDELQRKVDDMH